MEAGKITAKAANKRFSKALEQIRKTEIVELQPKAAPQGAEFQGRSAWQRVPYYPGQTPTRWAPRGGAMYKNPAWSPSLNELALAALTPSQLAYMRSEYKRNAERFGADAIWLAHHPAVVAAALTTFTLGPEADPFIVDLADAFSAIAAGKALKGRHYLEAGLDAASFGFSKFAANAARAARNEQSAAVEARATAQAAEHAIEMHPRIPQTPSFLVQEFKSAQKALRKAELGATRLRKLAAYERRVAGAFAYAAAEADVAR
jgi:hypothetical protein